LDKAQAGTEMVIVLALALAVLSVMFVVNTDVMGRTNTRIRQSKARTAMDDIGDAAELVYQQGAGSKMKVYIALPDSVQNFTVSGKTISIDFKGNGDTVYRNLDFDVNGTLPAGEGYYWINLEAMQGYVWINTSLNESS